MHHAPAVQFATLAHELAHLCLGHLGEDRALKIPSRPNMNHPSRELEAESVAYLVCARNDVQAKSEVYLSEFIRPDTQLDHMDLYAIMRAAGQVENLLGLASHTRFDKALPSQPQQGMLFRSDVASGSGA